MTAPKTEWRAESLESEGLPGLWCVYAGNRLIVTGLDKPTALDIAAVKEMKAALEETAHHADDEAGFMVQVRAALSKARGEGHRSAQATHNLDLAIERDRARITAEAQVRELREALEKYGEHGYSPHGVPCTKKPPIAWADQGAACICGLDQALSNTKDKTDG